VLLAGAISPAGSFTRRTPTACRGIHNNLAENAIRPSTAGKKNFLFVGSPGAGERSAIIYPIVVSCQRFGLDPWAYLRDMLTRLPTMSNQDDLTSYWAPKLATRPER